MGGKFVQLLIPLHSEPLTKPIISFDCETVGRENRFDFGVISWDDDHEQLFTSAEEMLQALTIRENTKKLIFATQLGFDSMVLFQAVAGDRRMPEGWSQFDNGSKLIWCKKIVGEYERKAKETGHADRKSPKRMYVTLLDSLNIFLGGVALMGEILQKVSKTYHKAYEKSGSEVHRRLAERYNVKKLPAPGCVCEPENVDHVGCKSWLGRLSFAHQSEAQRKISVEYCAADARTTRLFMEWFQEEIVKLGGQLKMTAASTAMDLFRRKYMRQEGRVIPQPHWTCLIESKLSYYGGRTEDFVKGTLGPVWDYDVASMYPSSMREISFPYPSPERFTKTTKPHPDCLQKEGFSHVKINIPKDQHIPPLPYREGSKLIFPTGQITGTWTNLELRHAIQTGCTIEDIAWSYFTSKVFNPYKGYVEDLFQKRMAYAYPNDCDSLTCPYHIHKKPSRKCDQQMATEEVIKLFLNGLYGKFAQNFLTEEQAEEIGIHIKKGGGTFKRIENATQEEFNYTAQNHPEYLIEGYVIDKAIPKLKAFMNPILSSYVTARARVKLHQMIQQANPQNVLYTDTDSLYTRKPLEFATEEKILGALQVGKQWQKITILGPKSKALITMPDEKGQTKSHYTAKGVPGKSFVYADDGTQIRTKPRAELFDSLITEEKPTVSYHRFLRFKESMARHKLPNEIVEITKTFDPFAFPKRKIIGKLPTLAELARREIKTEPWHYEDGQIVNGIEKMLET